MLAMEDWPNARESVMRPHLVQERGAIKFARVKYTTAIVSQSECVRRVAHPIQLYVIGIMMNLGAKSRDFSQLGHIIRRT